VAQNLSLSSVIVIENLLRNLRVKNKPGLPGAVNNSFNVTVFVPLKNHSQKAGNSDASPIIADNVLIGPGAHICRYCYCR
jgi:hypothetical protein